MLDVSPFLMFTDSTPAVPSRLKSPSAKNKRPCTWAFIILTISAWRRCTDRGAEAGMGMRR